MPPFSEDPDYPFPPVPPQSEAVDPGTDVITVGVGGNSLGFGDMVFTCLQQGSGSGGEGTPCRDELADGIPERLTKVSEEYGEMLATLQERAPHAKILTVGYPTIIPDDASKCRYDGWEQFGSITPGDLDWLREDVLEPLNEAIEKSAGNHDASFVNLYDSSRNHSVCDADKWVDGIFTRFPDQIAFVHPNAKGHQNAADQVSSALLNALNIA